MVKDPFLFVQDEQQVIWQRGSSVVLLAKQLKCIIILIVDSFFVHSTVDDSLILYHNFLLLSGIN